VKVADAIAYF